MAAAECIPVNVEQNETEDIKKLNGSNGDTTNGCEKNGKTEDSPAEAVAPETTTDNSNTESTEQSEKTGTLGEGGEEDVCEEEPTSGNEESGDSVEPKKDTVSVEEVESNEADESEDGVPTKRPADDGECLEEPSKKLCPEGEDEVNSE